MDEQEHDEPEPEDEDERRVAVPVIDSVMVAADVRGWTRPGALEVLTRGEPEQGGTITAGVEDEQGTRGRGSLSRCSAGGD